MYLIKVFPSDEMFIFWDLILVLPLASLMGYAGAARTLDVNKPNAKLISVPVIASVFGNTLLVLITTVILRLILAEYSWYLPQGYQATPEMSDDDIWYLPGYNPTILFHIVNFQIVFSCFLYTSGPPFRASCISNLPFVATLVVLAICCGCLLFLDNNEDLDRIVKMMAIPEYSFRFILFVGI